MQQFYADRRLHVRGAGAVLDLCFTHPSFQKMGAGKLLVGWGTRKADELGVPAWVEGSVFGRGLYQKFGFGEGGGVLERVRLGPWGADGDEGRGVAVRRAGSEEGWRAEWSDKGYLGGGWWFMGRPGKGAPRAIYNPASPSPPLRKPLPPISKKKATDRKESPGAPFPGPRQNRQMPAMIQKNDLHARTRARRRQHGARRLASHPIPPHGHREIRPPEPTLCVARASLSVCEAAALGVDDSPRPDDSPDGRRRWCTSFVGALVVCRWDGDGEGAGSLRTEIRWAFWFEARLDEGGDSGRVLCFKRARLGVGR
ncbi:GNAT family acetyltransferase [Diplocarpon mali]|nr:GNAT family acetyltransferase [Diplocarpon mali]